jgi:hypothetical protein
MKSISLLGFAACSPNADLRAELAFPVSDIDRESIPPLLRRRSSQATQMAFSAASAVCAQTGRSPALLPAIFASVAGEIQTTDQLCRELVKADGVISPSAFHNSVQNTVAGYWSIASQCTQAATALAAGHDSFAMALIEAWCQLACHGGELLLVCYDESWPIQLDPGRGEPAFACALLLAAGTAENAIASIERPCRGSAVFPVDWQAKAQQMPILATLPFLTLVANGKAQQATAISASDLGWQVTVTPLSTNRGAP